MKRTALSIALCGIGLLTAATSPAQTTDKAKFDALLRKYTVSDTTPFKPKGACVCSPGTDNRAGFLVLNPNGTVTCGIPSFDVDGSLGPYVLCDNFEVLAK
jgi:hypothetical protein